MVISSSSLGSHLAQSQILTLSKNLPSLPVLPREDGKADVMAEQHSAAWRTILNFNIPETPLKLSNYSSDCSHGSKFGLTGDKFVSRLSESPTSEWLTVVTGIHQGVCTHEMSPVIMLSYHDQVCEVRCPKGLVSIKATADSPVSISSGLAYEVIEEQIKQLPGEADTETSLALRNLVRIAIAWFSTACRTTKYGARTCKFRQRLFGGGRRFLWLPVTLLAFPALADASGTHQNHGANQGQHVVSSALTTTFWLLRELGMPLNGTIMGTSTVGWLVCQVSMSSTTTISASFKTNLAVACFSVMVASTVAYIGGQCMLYRYCNRPRREVRHMMRDYIGRTLALVLTLTVGLFLHQGSATTPHVMITYLPAFFSLSSFLCSFSKSVEWVPDLEQAFN